MRGLADTRPPFRRGLGRGAGRIRRVLHALELALQVRRERRMLQGMDDRTLKDIGFDRGKAYTEAQRPFWDIPVDRLRL